MRAPAALPVLLPALLLALLCLPATGRAADGLDPEAVNSAVTRDGRAGILRAQILLERAHFSPGEIDGRQGANTRGALRAYQEAHGLDASGRLDAATWDALNAQAPAQVLVTVTLDPAVVGGPFTAIPEPVEEQAALSRMGFEDAAEAAGEQYRASPALLRALNPDTGFAPGTPLRVPAVADLAPPAKAAKIVVDESDAALRLLDAQGQVLARYPASTGSEHDPLPIGDWKVDSIATDPTFHYNPELFWDADPDQSQASLPPGPNNPVGVAWIDLSKDHYGIHGTPVPSHVGKTQSHGCIRLTNWSVREVVQAIDAGIPVVLQE